MSLCSEFGCVSASSQDVRVGEGGVAFGACEAWAVLPAASVYVYPPYMTSSASRLARYGASECACMLWSAPSSLAFLRMELYVVVDVFWGLCGLDLSSLRIPVCMSAILVV